MMRTIHLHGRLKKQFGASHRFDVHTAAEALRALNCAFPGEFVTALQSGSYKIVRGDKRNGMHLDLGLVTSFNLGQADLHVIPAAAGAGNGKGIAKTIVGVALVGAAIFMAPASAAGIFGGMSANAFSVAGVSFTWGNIALLGLGVALSGVSTMLAGNSASSSKDSAKDDSFTTNGPSNVASQGSAIQLIYGEVMTAAPVVSFDANIEDIGTYQGATASLGESVQAVRNPDGSVSYYGAAVP